MIVYAVYMVTCVTGNWYYRKKYPEKYIRGADGRVLRIKSYFLKDLEDQSVAKGLENKSYDVSR